MSQLHVETEQTARAAGAFWALVSDATRYPEWGPWSAVGYQRPGDDSPRGPGAVQWLRSSRRAYLRYPTKIEKETIMNIPTAFDRRHPRGVIVTRLLVTVWLLALTGILVAYGHWGWTLLTLAGAVANGVWAYRIYRATMR